MMRKWGVHVFCKNSFLVKNSLSEIFWQGSRMVKMAKPSIIIIIQSNTHFMDACSIPTPQYFAPGKRKPSLRVCTESWILEKVLKFAQQFSRPGKSLVNGDKVRRNGKKSWAFFQAKTSALYVIFLKILVKSYSISPKSLQCIMKTVVFLHFLQSLLITCLITLSLQKKIIVLEKVWKKSWISDPKICMNPADSFSKFHPLNKDTPLMWRLRNP